MKVIGKVCEKHPGLNGARYERFFPNGKKKEGRCVGCQSEVHKKWITGNGASYRTENSKRTRQWEIDNREKRNSQASERRKNKPEYSRNYNKKRWMTQKDALQMRFKEWYANNAHVCVANSAKRYASKTNATPAWANPFFISEIYALARARTKHTKIQWHVDHIVPLRSKNVCGLHCEHNLRVVPASVNREKNNVYWPDMAGETL